MEEDGHETVMDISSKTWDVMHINLRKEGYREGAASGKESVVQPSFDIGYSEGFKLAYAKGVILGVVSVLENEKKNDGFNVTEVKNYLLNDRNCVICNSENPEIRNCNVKGALKYVQETVSMEMKSLKNKSGQLLRSINLEPDVICEKK